MVSQVSQNQYGPIQRTIPKVTRTRFGLVLWLCAARLGTTRPRRTLNQHIGYSDHQRRNRPPPFDGGFRGQIREPLHHHPTVSRSDENLDTGSRAVFTTAGGFVFQNPAPGFHPFCRASGPLSEPMPIGCGGGLRSHDLQVMSLTSYWAALPRY